MEFITYINEKPSYPNFNKENYDKLSYDKQSNPLLEFDFNGNLIRKYDYANDKLVRVCNVTENIIR